MTKDNRPIVVRASLGRLRQGLIFTCAAAEGYSGCEAHGLIVTAQCDLAHDKAPIVNFVPIVSLEHWLARDAEVLLARRVRVDEMKALRKQLELLDLSPALLETETPQTIVDAFILGDSAQRVTRKQRARAEAFPRVIADAESVLEGRTLEIPLRAQHKKPARTLLQELLAGSLAGYYFLPCVSPVGDHTGHVALLRQVYHLPRGLAHDLSRGVTVKELNERLGDATLAGIDGAREPQELVQPIGQLASPFLEHAMQAFGNMFTRIGVTDIADDFESTIVGAHFPAEIE